MIEQGSRLYLEDWFKQKEIRLHQKQFSSVFTHYPEAKKMDTLKLKGFRLGASYLSNAALTFRAVGPP